MADNDEQDPTERIAELETQLQASKGTETELAGAKRELAFAKAGVDTDSKLGKMLFQTYDGDLSDVAALKAEATELGLLTAEPPPEGGAGADEGANEDLGTETRRALANGSTADTGVQEDPMERTLAEARDHLDNHGYSFEKAAGHLINQRANAALGGDARVLFIPQTADQRV